jgi:hypothetical protein
LLCSFPPLRLLISKQLDFQSSFHGPKALDGGSGGGDSGTEFLADRLVQSLQVLPRERTEYAF